MTDNLKSANRDSFDAYLRQISEAPLLTRADEVELSSRMLQGERDLFAAALASGAPLPEIVALADAVFQGHEEPSELVDPPSLDSGVHQRFETARRLEERFQQLHQKLVAARFEERAVTAEKIDALCPRRVRAVEALGLNRRQALGIANRVFGALEPLAAADAAVAAATRSVGGLGRRDIAQALRRRRLPRGVSRLRLEHARAAIVEADRAIREVEERVARPRKALRPALTRMQAAAQEIRIAKERFTRSNLRLVVAWARRYVGFGLALGDLVQEGNIGLMRAVERFDHRVGTRFSTYASWWVRQALQRALQNTGASIRVPVHAQASLRRAARVRRDLMQNLGRSPDELELAEALDSSVEKVRELTDAAPSTISLEAPMSREAGERTLLDTLADQNAVVADDEVVTGERRRAAQRLLARLSAREQLVVRMRYGIGGRSYTLAEVGKQLKVTRERVRQIEAEALDKLRATAASVLQI